MTLNNRRQTAKPLRALKPVMLRLFRSPLKLRIGFTLVCAKILADSDGLPQLQLDAAIDNNDRVLRLGLNAKRA